METDKKHPWWKAHCPECRHVYRLQDGNRGSALFRALQAHKKQGHSCTATMTIEEGDPLPLSSTEVWFQIER